MKKIFAIALALTLVLSMGTTAFAADYVDNVTIDNVGTTSFDINGKMVDSTQNVVVLSVDIKYGAMKFVYYSGTDGYLWNPTNHSYEDNGDGTNGVGTGQWVAENESNFLTVVNHSNSAVGVKVSGETSLEREEDGESHPVNVVFKNSSDDYSSLYAGEYAAIVIESADGTAYEAAPSTTYEINLDGGTINDGLTEDFQPIGSVTVSIIEGSFPAENAGEETP